MIWRLLLAVVLLLPLASGYNYCNNKTHKCVLEKKKHFMCHLKDFTVYGNSTKFHASVPNNMRMQKIALDILNSLRNKFAGGELRTKGNKTFAKARRMRQLVWDKELAYMGHNHASTLSLRPSECRSTLRFPHVGEAIALVTPKEKLNLKEIYSKAFTSLFAEYQHVPDPDALLQAFDPDRDFQVKFFTNIISDRVSRMGCGLAVGANCHPTFKFCHFLTCYFDFHNMAGSYVYKAGDPTSSCDDWGVVSSDKYANLCKNSGEIFPHDHGDRVE